MSNLTNETVTNKTELTVSFVALGILFCLVYFSFITTASIVGSFEEKEKQTVTEEVRNLLALRTFTESDRNDAVVTDRRTESLVPERIFAPSIELDAKISNPPSQDLGTLDSALLNGVVYYPGSGFLDENSNIFLFGHSSFLPIVQNQNFKIFNKIKDLKIGESIFLEAEGERFEYQVISNRLVKDHEVRIDFDTELPMLTLATCNSFGEKEDRYVIEAVLVE